MRKFRVRKKLKMSNKLLLVGFLIFFFTFCMFHFYSKSASNKMISVAKLKLEEFMEVFLSENIGYDILDGELDNILLINKNDNEEILYVDFDLDNAYRVLDIVTDKLNTLISDLEKGKIDVKLKNVKSENNGFLVVLPMFINSDNILLANLGPKVYVPVSFVGTILTNIRSEVKDYGINSALVELYVTIKLRTNLIAPVSVSDEVLEYDVLIASKVISGRVPHVYGGSIKSSSNVVFKNVS